MRLLRESSDYSKTNRQIPVMIARVTINIGTRNVQTMSETRRLRIAMEISEIQLYFHWGG